MLKYGSSLPSARPGNFRVTLKIVLDEFCSTKTRLDSVYFCFPAGLKIHTKYGVAARSKHVAPMIPIVEDANQEGKLMPGKTSSEAPTRPKIKKANINKDRDRDNTIELLGKRLDVRFLNKSWKRSNARPDKNNSAEPMR